MAYFPNSSRKIRLGRPMTYPWDEWTDGEERVLIEGDDFSCMAESFVLLARRTAKVRGLHAVVSAMTVARGAEALPIMINGQQLYLSGGHTYVILKFTRGE
jgi:hypothetical protein